MRFFTKDFLSSLIVGMLFLLPPTNIGNILMMMCIIVLYAMSKTQIPNSSVVVFILVGLFISFSLNFVILSPWEYKKSVIRTISLSILFLLFPYVNNDVKIKEWLPFVLLSIIVLSQFADILSIKPLLAVINYIYPQYDQYHIYGASGVDFSFGMVGRYGGIYRNPNNCGRSILLVTMLYLIITHEKENNTLKDSLILFTALVGVLTTGSRTNVIIFMILIVSCVYVRNDSIPAHLKPIVLFFIGIIGYCFYYFFIGGESRLTSTSFEIHDRERLFTSLMESITSSVPHFLFGFFFHESLQTLDLGFGGGFDGDLGNMIYYYGFLNCTLITVFVFSIYKRSGKIFFYILPIFFTIVSNGLFSSFQSSFHIMILLSVCLSYTSKYR